MVIEMGGHGNHRVGDHFPNEGFGTALEVAQDHGRDLLGGQDLRIQGDHDVPVPGFDKPVGHPFHGLDDLRRSILPADKPLDREDRVPGVRDRLPQGQVADQALAGGRERNDGRRRGKSLKVGDNDGAFALKVGDAGKSGSQVDSDDPPHVR